MKFTSQILAEARGSVGGCTYSRNRFGRYIRTRAVPVNPSSSFQQAMRASLASLVQHWTSSLSAAEREAWDTYASLTPKTDNLGQSYNQTGQNAFIATNTLRAMGSLAVLEAAPTVFAGTSLTPPTIATIDDGDQSADITYTNTDPWATAVGGKLFIFVSRPQNMSRSFFKGPYRHAATVSGAVSPPAPPAIINLPFTVSPGQRLFFGFRAISADGRLSNFTTTTDFVP